MVMIHGTVAAGRRRRGWRGRGWRGSRGCEQVPARYCLVRAAIPGRYGDARVLACRNRQRYLVQMAFASALSLVVALSVANC